MPRQAHKELELLEICNYFEKVLRDGSRSSIDSFLELLSRDDYPYTPMLKEKGLSIRTNQCHQSRAQLSKFYI